MKVKIKIVSYSVLHNAISIRLLCEDPEGLANEARDEKRRVSLDDLSFEAKIRSINIQREGTNILLRTKRNRFLCLLYTSPSPRDRLWSFPSRKPLMEGSPTFFRRSQKRGVSQKKNFF